MRGFLYALCDFILSILLILYVFIFGSVSLTASIFMLIDVIIIHFFNEQWHFFEFVYAIPMDFCIGLLSLYLPKRVAMHVYFFVFNSSMAILLFLIRFPNCLDEFDPVDYLERKYKFVRFFLN